MAVSKALLDKYIKLFKLPAGSTWDDVLAERQRRKDNSNPCYTNATNFDYSAQLTDEQIIENMRDSIEREKKRRAVQWDYEAYSSWEEIKELAYPDKQETDMTEVDKKYVVRSEAIRELISRINALGSFSVPNPESYEPGQVISKDKVKVLGKTINDNEIACLCDCNYCTCDCNYCTCDCNYCTCDCNYHDNLVKSSYFGTTTDYGDSGTKNRGKTSVDDKTVWDKSVNTTDGTIWAIDWCNCDCNYCTCNCNYCTCDCNYCTCDCNYCTCDCNYCTCDCNYCTCDCNYKNAMYRYWFRANPYDSTKYDGTQYAYGSRSSSGSVSSYCTCDCNYCTCDCNYCTCNCNYCTCNCNYCTCDCNYCTCDCNQCVVFYYGRCRAWG